MVHQFKKQIGWMLALGLLISLVGCSRKDMNAALWEKVDSKDSENMSLEMQVQKLQTENENLRQRYETLAALPRDKRISAIAGLESIQIGRRSGLYDKDNNGTQETLVVYVKTTDDTGDVIKYPGAVQVQLWNLADSDDALLGQWHIEPEQLKTTWASTMMTNYYRLDFPIEGKVTDQHKDLTVKITFTDYFTGTISKDQREITR